ncbi:MAG TPA: carboxypeptidase-like regulatory domain-containing protein [Longimicrobiaceae bacterium]|nr:carboxypeptidase-like regulatory domain-containing protein [Longimicrobiaceae bacterium]
MPRLPHALAALLLAALALLPAAAQGQGGSTARLSVVVVDSASRPVAGTRVQVGGAPAAAWSDSAGVAVVVRIPAGSRLVQIQRTGYVPEKAVIRFDPGADLRIQVTLTATPFTLDTLQVVAWRQRAALARAGFYKRQQQGQGSFLTRSDLAELETFSSDLGFALGRLRGFRVDRGAGGRLAVVSTRGAASLEGGCTPRVYVDGIPADMELLGNLQPGEVEAVEGYSGAGTAPGEYAGSSTCGVILVWTRSGP